MFSISSLTVDNMSRLTVIDVCLHVRPLQRPPERYNPEDDLEDVARSASATKPPHGPGHQLAVPYSIPRALAVAPSLGGEPVSPELAVVSLQPELAI